MQLRILLGKLAPHLGGHHYVRNAVCFTVFPNGRQVKAQLFGNYMHLAPIGKSGIGIPYVCVKAVACICRRSAVAIQTDRQRAGVNEGAEITMGQHTALGRARCSGGIKEDKAILGLWRRKVRRGGGQGWYFIGKQHRTVVIRKDGQKRSIRDQQPCARVFAHEIQSLRRIGGIQRLVHSSGLQYAKACRHHIFTAWYQYGYHLTPSYAKGTDMSGNAVADFIQSGIAVPLVAEHRSGFVWAGGSRAAEHIYNCLIVVVWNGIIVESVQKAPVLIV